MPYNLFTTLTVYAITGICVTWVTVFWRDVKMHLNSNIFVCVTSRDTFWLFLSFFSISSILQSLCQISFIQVGLKISLKYSQQK